MFVQEFIDLPNCEIVQAELGGSDQFFDLAGMTTSDNCSGYRGIAQDPGNCDFTGSAIVGVADVAQQVRQFQVA